MTSPLPHCRCVLCHDYGDRDEFDQRDLTTIDNVRRHGWSVQMVLDDELGPGWAYTIGLRHSHDGPELAMFGLKLPVMEACLNTLGDRVAAGDPVAAEHAAHDVVEGYPVLLKPVDPRWYPSFFGRALAFYRRPPLRYLQVVWPDKAGRFPWDAGSAAFLGDRQPQLWRSPADHPTGVWTQDL